MLIKIPNLSLFFADPGGGESGDSGGESGGESGSESTELPPAQDFNFDSWKEGGADVNKLPSHLRQVYDHGIEAQRAQTAYNPTETMRRLIGDKPKEDDSIPDRESYTPEEVQQLLNKRSYEQQVRQAREKFVGDLETMMNAPINLADGAHIGQFKNDSEVSDFYKYVQDVFTKRAFTPQDLYKLWAWDRIMADVGEHSAMKREEALRRKGGSKKPVETQPKTEEIPKDGGKKKSLTVEDLFKQNNPEAYAGVMSGNKPFGAN